VEKKQVDVTKATPKLSIIKGILIIVFGTELFCWGINSALFSRTISYRAIGFSVICLFVCLWLGIRAIQIRNVKAVSNISVGVLAILVIALFVMLVWLF
jgi:hypothetical protein